MVHPKPWLVLRPGQENQVPSDKQWRNTDSEMELYMHKIILCTVGKNPIFITCLEFQKFRFFLKMESNFATKIDLKKSWN